MTLIIYKKKFLHSDWLILLVYEKFTRAYLFQIALEIMWLPIQKQRNYRVTVPVEVKTDATLTKGSSAIFAHHWGKLALASKWFCVCKTYLGKLLFCRSQCSRFLSIQFQFAFKVRFLLVVTVEPGIQRFILQKKQKRNKSKCLRPRIRWDT